MPYINILTSEKVENKKKLLEEITTLISSLTKKSKKFVMGRIDDNSEMYFQDESPCCFLEIKSIGSLNPREMAKPLSDFVDPSSFKSYAELQRKLYEVLGEDGVPGLDTKTSVELNETAEPKVDAPTPAEPVAAAPVAEAKSEEDDDALSYFAKLAQQD